MPLAEIHGILPQKLRRSEDLLTAAAFGTLTTTPPDFLLLPWLNAARRLDGSALKLAPCTIQSQFWPSLALPVSGSVIPDLVMTLNVKDGVADVLLIEVKYASGPSGWPTAPEFDAELRGQLSKQWAALLHLQPHELSGRPRRLRHRRLLYITAEDEMPVQVLSAMGRELTQKAPDQIGFQEGCYWLSWRQLFRTLNAMDTQSSPLHLQAAASRLRELLVLRRLATFDGYTTVRATRIGWRLEPEDTPLDYSWAVPNQSGPTWRFEH